MRKHICTAVLLLASLISGGVAASVGSPTKAYTAYHKTAVEAKQLKDIEPHSSAATVAAMKNYVPEQLRAIFEMHKSSYENSKDFKVLSESIDGNTSTVVAKFCGSNGRVNDLKATLLLEAGMWKVDLVESASGADPC
ncbi:MAG: hypothetical protein ACI9WC_000446 [Arenicella sp.]|jgi:hypothetical protein